MQNKRSPAAVLRLVNHTAKQLRCVKRNRKHMAINIAIVAEAHGAQLVRLNEKCSPFYFTITDDIDEPIFSAKVKEYIEVTVEQNEDGELQVVQRSSDAVDHDKCGALLKLMKLDHYQTLHVSRDATDAEIRRAYLHLSLLHHPDRNENSVLSKLAFQKINESFVFLSDPERRQRYDVYLDHKCGFFSVPCWRALWRDKRRRRWFIFETALVVGGFAIIAFATATGIGAVAAASATPLVYLFALPCAVGGTAVGSGTAGIRYALSEEAAVFGINTRQLVKMMATHGLMGAVVGAASCGIGQAASAALQTALPEVSAVGVSTLTGATSAGADGVLWGGGVVLAQAAVEGRWKNMDPEAAAIDFLRAIAVGGTFGATAGAVAGGISGAASGDAGTAGTAVDEIAGNVAGVMETELRAGVSSMMHQIRAPVAGNLPRAVATGAKLTHVAAFASKLPICSARIAVNQTLEALIRGESTGPTLPSEPDLDEAEDTLVALLRGGVDPTIAFHSVLTSSRNLAVGDELASGPGKYVSYHCKGTLLHSRAVVTWKENDRIETRFVYSGHTLNFDSAKLSADVEIRFEVMRRVGVFEGVRKYDRKRKCFVKPAEPEAFRYAQPPAVRFTLKGTLGLEKIAEVRDERELLLL